MKRLRRGLILVMALAILGLAPGPNSASGQVIPDRPIYSTALFIDGGRIGFLADGRLVSVMPTPSPLGSEPGAIFEVYLYPTGFSGPNCNGASHMVRTGFDTDRNPVAAYFRLTSCGTQTELGLLPVAVLEGLKAGTLELIVVIPQDVLTANDPFTALARACFGASCALSTSFPYDPAMFDERVSCDGEPITLFGTESDDTLVGTDGPDVIRGFDGDDTVRGKGGDDVICLDDGDDNSKGGPGADATFGGRGDDSIRDGPGKDFSAGGPGDDAQWGGSGDDTLSGQRGDDVLSGGSGSDKLRGRAGNDTIRGGPGGDKLVGGSGDDVMNGQKGKDKLFGNGDNDLLLGGPGNDVLSGGRGNDDDCRGGAGFDQPVAPFGCELTKSMAGKL